MNRFKVLAGGVALRGVALRGVALRGVALIACVGCAPELLGQDGATPPGDRGIADGGTPPDDMQLEDDAAVPGDMRTADASPAEDATPDIAEDAALDPEPNPEPEPTPDPDPAPAPEGPARYPADRLVSPLTPFAVDALRAVIAAAPDRDDHIFSKVGASATVSASYLHCFAGDAIDLDGRPVQPAIDWFLDGEIDGVTPFERQSETTVVGWHAGRALAGDPSPLQREIDAANPRFATIQYGTNDVGIVSLDTYGDNLLTVVDTLLEQGVIPVLSTVMPRGDSAVQDAKIPAFNTAVRAVAQARQIPLVDLHLAIRDLPNQGLANDQIHPSVYRADGQRRACDFSMAGLAYGYNWRNLLTIQAFSGLVDTLLRDAPAPDPPMPPLMGAGTPADPIRIDALPFVDSRDTAAGPSQAIDVYPGCNAAQDESGPEWVYRFELVEPTVIEAFVLDRGDVDVDLHLLGADAEGGACLERAHERLTASLGAGRYHLVVDTFVGGNGVARSGPFLVGVLAVDPD